jgi:hypothetical protein
MKLHELDYSSILSLAGDVVMLLLALAFIGTCLRLLWHAEQACCHSLGFLLALGSDYVLPQPHPSPFLILVRRRRMPNPALTNSTQPLLFIPRAAYQIHLFHCYQSDVAFFLFGCRFAVPLTTVRANRPAFTGSNDRSGRDGVLPP